MSPLFVLASDFIERMANPAYGIRVNEDHALRFAALLEREGVQLQLREEAANLSSAETLTAHGWVWLLTWARSEEIHLSEDLLLHLAGTWSSVFLQALVIDVATADVKDTQMPDKIPPASLSNMEHPFLRRFLESVTSVAAISEGDIESEEFSTQRAENALVALLQVDRPVTVSAAQALLEHRWQGQSQLLGFYRVLRAGLDEGTGETWDRSLKVDFFGQAE